MVIITTQIPGDHYGTDRIGGLEMKHLAFICLFVLLTGCTTVKTREIPGGESVVAEAPVFNSGDVWVYMRGSNPDDTFVVDRKLAIDRGNWSQLNIGNFPYRVGKKWTQLEEGLSVDQAKDTYEHTFQVLAYETIELPGGTFEAFRIRWHCHNPSNGWRGNLDLWYAPVVKNFVKCHVNSARWEIKGFELISYMRGTGKPVSTDQKETRFVKGKNTISLPGLSVIVGDQFEYLGEFEKRYSIYIDTKSTGRIQRGVVVMRGGFGKQKPIEVYIPVNFKLDFGTMKINGETFYHFTKKYQTNNWQNLEKIVTQKCSYGVPSTIMVKMITPIQVSLEDTYTVAYFEDFEQTEGGSLELFNKHAASAFSLR